jgi:hypothetical protein
VGAPGKGPDGGPGVWEHAKDQQIMGDRNAGAVAEESLTSTGKDVGGAGAQDRARADEPPVKDRV